MTKPHHVYALLRGDGTERCTTTAASRGAAAKALRRAIKKAAFPVGWRIKDLGPVDRPAPEPTPKATDPCPQCGEPWNKHGNGGVDGPICLTLPANPPAPRPFKVGDRAVVTRTDAHCFPLGAVVKLLEPREYGFWCSREMESGDVAFQGLRPDQMRLLEPAPEPKAEEGTCKDGQPHDWRYASRCTKPGFESTARCQRCDERQWLPVVEPKGMTKVDLVEKFTTELGEALGQRTPWSDMVHRVAGMTAALAAKDQEIAALKADLEEVRRNSRGMLDAFCEALDMPGEFWGELVAAAKFNKAQVKVLKAQVGALESRLDLRVDEREAAEAKLADIQSMLRAMQLMAQATQTVLDR